MKKLMIAAAIVCAAVMAQAATFDWSYTAGPFERGDDDSYDPVQGTVALVMNDMVVAASEATLDGGFGGTTFAADNGASNVWALRLTTTIDGVQKYMDSDTFTLGALNWDDPTSYKKALGDKMSAAVFSMQDSELGAISFKDSRWQAVPEPTSGLLLLLGVAGLALRRRRAKGREVEVGRRSRTADVKIPL